MAERTSPLLGEIRAVQDDLNLLGKEVRGRLKLNVTGAVMVNIYRKPWVNIAKNEIILFYLTSNKIQ